MKQGNPTKKFGRIAFLMAVISGMFKSTPNEKVEVMKQKNGLLLNFGNAMPRKILNQRQKRKRYRQSHHCN